MTPKELWKAVKAELEVNLSKLQYGSWIANTAAGELTEKSFEIICPSEHAAKILEKQFLSLIQSSVDKIGKKSRKLIFRVGDTSSKRKADVKGPLFDINRTPERSGTNVGLYQKYTFENYIMGESNRLAYAIATAIAEKPGEAYNPFFLYSGVGLGKTHLVQAIGNRIINKQKLKVIYCTGESFTNELIESLQSGKGRGKYASNQFRNKYRKADVLLIDDIQFIVGKEATQQEFFHTFNALYMAQKQIVVTSDKPPKDFTNLEERITSRFGSGIIADIQPPNIETRSAILRNKRDQNKDAVTNEAIDQIATIVDTNIRELEGAYLQVLTYAKATGESITKEAVTTILGQTVKEKKHKPVNLNQILRAVCNYYSVKMIDIKGKRRTKDLVVPRQMAMYLIHDLTETPYMSIGEVLGGRDHTTIMHGVRKIEGEIIQIQKTRQDITNIKQTLTVP